jgi:hypothetical protein
MKTKHLLLGALLAAAFLPAVGASLDAEEGQAQDRPAADARKRFQIALRDNGPRKIIKDLPYSAEMVSERTQVLADGNQIVHKSSTMSYRDSAGRTRHETRNSNGEVTNIAIEDPSQNMTWILHPKDKTAIKLNRPGPGTGPLGAHMAIEGRLAAAEAGRAAAAGASAGAAARARVEQMRRDGTLPAGEQPKNADGSGTVIKNVVVQIRDGKDPGAARAMHAEIGPMLTEAFADREWAAHSTQKDLGSRDFAGVTAQGKLRSYEIPANAIGNRNPIVVSDEQWYAPELQVTVYTRHSDPRSGEAVYRLENLKRGEPAAALFTAPSDYTVRDLSRHMAAPAGGK